MRTTMQSIRDILLSLAGFCLLLAFAGSARAEWEYVTPPSIYYGVNNLVSHGGELYAVSNGGLYRTANGGDSWTDMTEGFILNPGNANYDVVFHGENIFISSSLMAVYMSPDGGDSWQVDSTGMESSYAANLLFQDDDRLYASMAWPTYGLYTKSAAAGPWSRIEGPLGSAHGDQVTGMCSHGGVLYAATLSQGVHATSDDGASWQTPANEGYPAEVAGWVTNRLCSDGSALFVASSNGVFRSADGGDSWQRVDSGFATWNQFNVTPIMTIDTYGGSLFASTAQDDSAYVSDDSGSSWSDISDGEPLAHWVKSFCVHEGQLYAAQWDTDSALVRRDLQVDVAERPGMPAEFRLLPNAPNPFNPVTTIRYSLPVAGSAAGHPVRLAVYNMLGQHVTTLVEGRQPPGEHQVTFLAEDLPSGLYVYSLQSGNFRQERTMLLVK